MSGHKLGILAFLGVWLLASCAAAAPPLPAAPSYSSMTAGSPSGGHKGNGSINAESYYVNGAPLGGAGGSTLTFGPHFGGGSFNGSVPITITIDATSVPTPGTIAARDANGELFVAASTLANAGINIAPGLVPTSPADGDFWSTPVGFFGQVNGSTVGPFSTGGGGGGNVSNSGTPAANQLAQWVSNTAIRGLALNAGVGAAFANALNNSGGLLAYSLIGTTGATIPLLNGFNTWSGNNTFSGTLTGTLTGHASLDLRLTGGTITGELITPASTTGTAGFNLPQGAAPSAPVNGDLWTTSGGLFARIAGSTVGPLGPGTGTGNVSSSGTPVANQLAQWVSSTGIQGINLNAGAATALGNALNGSGGLLAFSIIGTSGGTLGLLNAANTWSGVQSFNDGDLSLKGSSSGGSVLHAPATGGGAVTLPAGAVTLLGTTGSASGLTGLLPKASGGTGTATPSLVPGTNVTITGSWPNQTINATGGGASVSITAGTPDLVVSPDPITGTGTISTQTLLNTQSTSSYAILTGDLAKVVEMTNAAATTMTIAAAGAVGFGADWGTTILPTLAPTTITPATGTICNLPSITIAAQTPLSIASDNAGNYVCAVGAPPSGTWVTSQRVIYQTPTIATATFTPAVNSGNNIRIGLTSACPCTLANFSGTLVAGQQGYIEVAQDGTGSRTIGTWGSAYVTVGGTASITLSTAASKVDYLPYAVDSTATKIVLGAIITGPTH